MSRTGFATVTSPEDIEIIKSQTDSMIVMQPGQQSDLMWSYCFETLITGEKGTGKSRASHIWLIRGNLDVPEDKKSQTDIFYINNPLFRGGAVRRNVDDLNAWVEDAKRIYGTKGDLLGATYTQQPREFTWPSGAKVICFHMGDSEAYMRLTGQPLTRLFWDEITFEADKDVYEKVYSSIRSPHKDMRAQILLACNPEGPGLPWVKERFITATDERGQTYKSGEVMRIKMIHPLTKEVRCIERMYQHWTMQGNPIFVANDPDYQARLANISNPSLRRAYLMGDWDAAGGKFFEFRRKRREDEPENACHVYDAGKVLIQPWWPRIIGLDWGYSHYFAAFKVALSPDGRVWVIDEMVQKGMGSKELGAALARWCAPDMAGHKATGTPPVIPIFISPDAIEQRRDDYGTTAENIMNGIIQVLGPGASEILSTDETGVDDFQLKRLIQYESKMPLRRATNRRKFGWDTIRQLLEWDSIAEPDLSQYSHDYALSLAERDAHEYFRYQKEFIKQPEALPKLQISSRLKVLPDALDSATSAAGDLEDVEIPKRGNKDIVQMYDDARDAFRYVACATLLYKEIKTPVAHQIEQAMAMYPDMTPEQRFQATPILHNRFSKKVVKGFRIGRGANAGVYIT